MRVEADGERVMKGRLGCRDTAGVAGEKTWQTQDRWLDGVERKVTDWVGRFGGMP